MQGELGLTSLANNTEINIADPNIAPYNQNCRNPVADPEFHLSTPFSERKKLRLTALSTTHRSEAREVIGRFRSLKPSDQQAMIDFLKEL